MIDELRINTLRMLSADMVDEAKSGHPGMCMGVAPALYTLFSKVMRRYDGEYFNRDRFVLSAGHGAPLLYALLYMEGKLELQDLKNLRQYGSKTPGHPEIDINRGIDVTTGPLGQGLAMAVGMAMAERDLASRFNSDGEVRFEWIDHHTYVLASDGDLMEGISYEAASFAGHHKLNKLIVLYDSNGISIDGPTDITFTEDIMGRFLAQNWSVHEADGEDISSIQRALLAAKGSDQPSLVILKTRIGAGSVEEGTPVVHGAPLRDLEDVREKYFPGVTEKFHVPEGFRLEDRDDSYLLPVPFEYETAYQNMMPERHNEWLGHECIPDAVYEDLRSLKVEGDSASPEATRVMSNRCISTIGRHLQEGAGKPAPLWWWMRAPKFMPYCKDSLWYHASCENQA